MGWVPIPAQETRAKKKKDSRCSHNEDERPTVPSIQTPHDGNGMAGFMEQTDTARLSHKH